VRHFVAQQLSNVAHQNFVAQQSHNKIFVAQQNVVTTVIRNKMLYVVI
jgi:hypothetical protein